MYNEGEVEIALDTITRIKYSKITSYEITIKKKPVEREEDERSVGHSLPSSFNRRRCFFAYERKQRMRMEWSLRATDNERDEVRTCSEKTRL